MVFIPLFLFFVLPAPITVPDFTPSSQIVSLDLDTNLMNGFFPDAEGSEDEDDAESETETSSRLVIDDDDKLPHYPSWSVTKPVQMYSDYSDVYLLDGITRRLFKPPKA